MKKMSKGFTSVYLKLALPSIIANLVVFATDNINVAILGSLSEKAISGCSIANESYSIFSMLSLGITGGFHVYISQLYGDNNKVKYNQVLRVGLKLITFIGFAFSLGTCLFAKQFINIFIQDPEMVSYGVEYLQIYSWTHLLYGINLLFSGVYTIIGQAKTAMFSGMLNCIVCCISSFALVNFTSLGVRGAALAVLFGRIAEFVYLTIIISQPQSSFKFSEKYPKLVGNDILDVFKTSLPLIVNETLYSIAFLLVVKNLSHISEDYIACYTIGNNTYKLFNVVMQGLGPAVGALVGRNLGTGNFEEAKRGADDILFMNLFSHLFFGVIMLACIGILPGFFSLEGDVAEMCKKCLLIKTIFGMLSGFPHCFYNILRIGGDTKRVLIMDGIFSMCFPAFLSYIFAYQIPLSFQWAYLIVCACDIVKTIIGFIFYFQGNWIKRLM